MKNLSVKCQIVNILDFQSLMVSVPTSQLYHCSAKVMTHGILMNECDCVPIQLYLQKPSVFWMCGELYFTNFCFKPLCFKVLRRQKSEDNYRPIETLVFKIRRDYSLNYQKKVFMEEKALQQGLKDWLDLFMGTRGLGISCKENNMSNSTNRMQNGVCIGRVGSSV